MLKQAGGSSAVINHVVVDLDDYLVSSDGEYNDALIDLLKKLPQETNIIYLMIARSVKNRIGGVFGGKFNIENVDRYKKLLVCNILEMLQEKGLSGLKILSPHSQISEDGVETFGFENVEAPINRILSNPTLLEVPSGIVFSEIEGRLLLLPDDALEEKINIENQFINLLDKIAIESSLDRNYEPRIVYISSNNESLEIARNITQQASCAFEGARDLESVNGVLGLRKLVVPAPPSGANSRGRRPGRIAGGAGGPIGTSGGGAGSAARPQTEKEKELHDEILRLGGGGDSSSLSLNPQPPSRSKGPSYTGARRTNHVVGSPIASGGGASGSAHASANSSLSRQRVYIFEGDSAIIDKVNLNGIAVSCDRDAEEYEDVEVRFLAEKTKTELPNVVISHFLTKALPDIVSGDIAAANVKKWIEEMNKKILKEIAGLTEFPVQIAFPFHSGRHWQVFGLEIKMGEDGNKKYNVHLFDSSTQTSEADGISQIQQKIIPILRGFDIRVQEMHYHKPYVQSGQVRKPLEEGVVGSPEVTVVDENNRTSDCGVYAMKTLENIANFGFEEAAKPKHPDIFNGPAIVAMGTEFRARQAVKMILGGQEAITGIVNLPELIENINAAPFLPSGDSSRVSALRAMVGEGAKR